MDPVSAHVVIDRPREEVFEDLSDIANHAEFTDHRMTDWRLTRIDSYGRGAGARFKTSRTGERLPRIDSYGRAAGARFTTSRKGELNGWAVMMYLEVDPPRRIVAAGRGG